MCGYLNHFTQTQTILTHFYLELVTKLNFKFLIMSMFQKIFQSPSNVFFKLGIILFRLLKCLFRMSFNSLERFFMDNQLFRSCFSLLPPRIEQPSSWPTPRPSVEGLTRCSSADLCSNPRVRSASDLVVWYFWQMISNRP